MTEWPAVMSEYETVAQLLRGYSLARMGDGELKLMRGSAQAREPANPELAAELRQIAIKPAKKCIVGVPTMDPEGPKYQNWTRHRDSFVTFLRDRVNYGSAFVSRPDSAPWINTVEYAELLSTLWRGKRVHVVCEPGNSLLKLVALQAYEAIHVPCPSTQAYSALPEIEAKLADAKLVIISAGPAATCLANRLALRGVQGVDLGSAGGFLLRLALSDCVQVAIMRPKGVNDEELLRILQKSFRVLRFDGKSV